MDKDENSVMCTAPHVNQWPFTSAHKILLRCYSSLQLIEVHFLTIISKAMVNFSAFFEMTNFCYSLLGYMPYDEVSGQRAKNMPKGIKPYLRKLFFIISLININWVLFTECAFVVVNFLENADFLQAARNLTFVGFVFVSDIKIAFNTRHSEHIQVLINKLYEMYPKCAKDQIAYNLEDYLKNYKRLARLEVLSYTFTAWSYNCQPILRFFIYKLWLQQLDVARDVPFYCWVPFEWRDNWLYYPLYISQAMAAQSCLSVFLGNDLLMCAAIQQLVIHFRKIVHDLNEYKVSGASTSARKDLKFLGSIVSRHQYTLELCELINEIFGVTIFISFSSTSFIICFLAFQYSVGVPFDAMVMLFSYMICSMSQIYMICSYGQELITTSEDVGHAVYNHDWHNADKSYKKMLAVIIQRAQKPATLRGTYLLNVSMATMTDLLQLSYKFFAVIRTMYAK
ncbi:putative odorant receptor 85d [Eurosta solidaginis]|uniref:putative odorant receptor 85d n=1 Tax=Eurosta solidaginis TaxID=178769 RepID=UPI003531044F